MTPPSGADLTRPQQAITRRTFFGRMGSLAVGLTFMPLAGCENNAFEPVIEGADLPFLTPNTSFYLQFGAEGAVSGWGGVPALSNEDWSLTLDGRFDRPLTLRLSDLQAEVPTTFLATLRCIVNSNAVPGLVGTAAWTGVPLRLFLERAGLDNVQTRHLHVYGADGFTDNLRPDILFGPRLETLPEPMLVYAMNGQPLQPGHGAPVRLLVPGHFGYKSVKWVTRIEATNDDAVFGSYQNVLGYADNGRIRVDTKVTSLLRSALIQPGPSLLSGFALSGAGAIRAVDIAFDEAPYRPARLVSLREIAAIDPDIRSTVQITEPGRYPYPFPGVWTPWDYRWTANEGTHRLRIRATDEAGETQPAIDTDPTDGENPIFELQVRVA